MSLLYLRSRPIVAFDVLDYDHRRYFHDFLRTGTWAHCPVRFMIEGLTTDLVTHISNELLRFYDEKAFREYDKANPVPQATVTLAAAARYALIQPKAVA